MGIAGRLLGAALAAAVLMTPDPASAQASASPAAAPAASYGSYLSAPAQDNRMLRGGLDADEIIGSEVVAADGSRVGAVTDLLAGDDGGMSNTAASAGQAP